MIYKKHNITCKIVKDIDSRVKFPGNPYMTSRLVLYPRRDEHLTIPVVLHNFPTP